jgi:hypothetical protein
VGGNFQSERADGGREEGRKEGREVEEGDIEVMGAGMLGFRLVQRLHPLSVSLSLSFYLSPLAPATSSRPPALTKERALSLSFFYPSLPPSLSLSLPPSPSLSLSQRACDVQSPASTKLGMGVSWLGRYLLRPGIAAYTDRGVFTTAYLRSCTHTRTHDTHRARE